MSQGGSKNRLDLYKRRNSTWKERFRERCLQRLKNSRDRILNRTRDLEDVKKNSIAEELLLEEWEDMNGDPTVKLRARLLEQDSSFDEETCEDDFLHEIYLELLNEEQSILNSSEDSKIEENANSHQVICPLCQKNLLHQNCGIISCLCGLIIDTEQDCLDLKYLKNQLLEGVSSHLCPNPPNFSTTNVAGINNLLITCKACEFMYVVI